MAVPDGSDDQRTAATSPFPSSWDPGQELQGFRGWPDDDGLGLDGLLASDDQGSAQAVPYDESSATRQVHAPRSQGGGAGESACPLTPRVILEAILFVGHPTSEGLSSRFLAALMRGVRPAEIDDLVLELNQEYSRLGCPYKIDTGTSGYRLVLRDEHLNLRESFYGKVRQAKLSQAAIDTLAVVAYRQPIARQMILDYCDTASPTVLAQLVRRGLLSVERTQPGANGWQYSTTDRFLDMFGLQTLSDLPRPEGDEAQIE